MHVMERQERAPVGAFLESPRSPFHRSLAQRFEDPGKGRAHGMVDALRAKVGARHLQMCGDAVRRARLAVEGNRDPSLFDVDQGEERMERFLDPAFQLGGLGDVGVAEHKFHWIYHGAATVADRSRFD